jgi:isocitrate lyase
MAPTEPAQSDGPKANSTFELSTDPQRWQGVVRPYAQTDVERLCGSFRVEYTIAKQGAERLWHLLKTEPPITALGAFSGNQAVQQVRAGLYYLGRLPHAQLQHVPSFARL